MNAQQLLVEWLRRGGPWGQAPDVVETHAAYVFLIDDRAYKLKKAIDLGYLDFSTLLRRREALERELTLNKRTAPAIYLRTLPITRVGEGVFALADGGDIVDWLLEMRRFPNDALLGDLADRGALDDGIVESLAAHIADFHDRAPPTVSCDWPAAVGRIARENSDDLRAQKDLFGAGEVACVVAAHEANMAACAKALQLQSADVRHCHGDLHLGNAFMDHGQPTLFDCIEFDDFYATIPPLYDLAFVLMDLLARNLPRLANRTLNAWIIQRKREAWHDIPSSLGALPLYVMLRAEIRAKTEGRRPGGLSAARGYLALVKKIAEPRPPRLIAIGGLSGTGKSSLAKDLGWRIGSVAGALHLRSDEIRKRIAGVPLTERLPESSYTRDMSDRVYEEFFELAKIAMGSGQSVILDAVFSREGERDRAAAIAAEVGVPFVGLWLEAPADILKRRLAARRNDASDADVAVLRKQLTYDLGCIGWQRVDVSADADECMQAARNRLGLG
ncbi:MAG: AAA family ATPase [Alphaproteobacteria bacterium]|nr:AAA family ATPase [Alphaproteobacteria bacterium]